MQVLRLGSETVNCDFLLGGKRDKDMHAPPTVINSDRELGDGIAPIRAVCSGVWRHERGGGRVWPRKECDGGTATPSGWKCGLLRIMPWFVNGMIEFGGGGLSWINEHGWAILAGNNGANQTTEIGTLLRGLDSGSRSVRSFNRSIQPSRLAPFKFNGLWAHFADSVGAQPAELHWQDQSVYSGEWFDVYQPLNAGANDNRANNSRAIQPVIFLKQSRRLIERINWAGKIFRFFVEIVFFPFLSLPFLSSFLHVFFLIIIPSFPFLSFPFLSIPFRRKENERKRRRRRIKAGGGVGGREGGGVAATLEEIIPEKFPFSL